MVPTETKVIAKWYAEIGAYITPQGWRSVDSDGGCWLDKNGHDVLGQEFREAIIVFSGGPRNGEEIL